MTNLKLTRPLIVFDIESTGLNIGRDQIIEISMIKCFPDGSREEQTRRIKPTPSSESRQLNGISPEAYAVHGISDEDLKDCPTFAEVADELLAYFGDSDIAGFNSNKFDIPLLAEEFLRIGKRLDMRNRYLVDVQQIFHKMEPRNLAAAYKFYCHKDIENAHSANADALATLEVLEAQIEYYKDVEYEDRNTRRHCPITPNVKDLDHFTRVNRNVDFASHIILNDKDVEVFNFGKHKGESVKEVFIKEPAFYSWMMRADFPLNTKDVITMIYNEVRLEMKFGKSNN